MAIQGEQAGQGASAGEAQQSADFRVVQQPKVALREQPDGRQTAVAPAGAVLHGLAEPHGGGLWLRIALRAGNPLREKSGLLAVWSKITADATDSIEWDGPFDADLLGNSFQVKWMPPFPEEMPAAYRVESRPEGDTTWRLLWKSDAPGSDPVEDRYVSSSVVWPHAGKKVAVRIIASCAGLNGTKDNLQLVSSMFTVNTSVLDLRTMDKGVPHLRKLKSDLLIARNKSKKANGEDQELVALVQQLSQEVEKVMEVRASILKRSTKYAPRRVPASCNKRIILGSGHNGSHKKSNLVQFKKVLVMGLYHSCTNAVAQELEKRFMVQVVNDWHTSKADAPWKHRVNEQVPFCVTPDCLILLMVKEPYFWLKSCSRETRNFFEIHPYDEDADGVRVDRPPKTLRDLFTKIEHDSILYSNAVEIWNDVVRSYLDDAVYPAHQSVIVRSEDFLFKFHKVMDELAAIGLQEKEDGTRPEPNASRAKGHMECRTRDQALDFYAQPENRVSTFLPEELAIVEQGLDDSALQCLSYSGANPVASWT